MTRRAARCCSLPLSAWQGLLAGMVWTGCMGCLGATVRPARLASAGLLASAALWGLLGLLARMALMVETDAMVLTARRVRMASVARLGRRASAGVTAKTAGMAWALLRSRLNEAF